MLLFLAHSLFYKVVPATYALGFGAADTFRLSFVTFDPSSPTIPIRCCYLEGSGAEYLHVAQPPLDLVVDVRENFVMELSMVKTCYRFPCKFPLQSISN